MICRNCRQDLPKESFTSTQAKYCLNCKRIVALEKRNAMMKRSLERQKNKKPKKTVLVPLKTLKRTAQRLVNKWVRERDSGENCLACLNYQEKMDASHYIAQGSCGYLRYHPLNIHDTCYACNRFKHGNLICYRINLVTKIGEDKVKWLEQNKDKIYQYTREQLELIIYHCKHNTYSVECWYEIMHKVS